MANLSDVTSGTRRPPEPFVLQAVLLTLLWRREVRRTQVLAGNEACCESSGVSYRLVSLSQPALDWPPVRVGRRPERVIRGTSASMHCATIRSSAPCLPSHIE
jgi:hypothetical protein